MPLTVLVKLPPLASSSRPGTSRVPRSRLTGRLALSGLSLNVSIFSCFLPIQLLTGGPHVFLTNVFEAGPPGSQGNPFLLSSKREDYQKLWLWSTPGLPGQHWRDLGKGGPEKIMFPCLEPLHILGF